MSVTVADLDTVGVARTQRLRRSRFLGVCLLASAALSSVSPAAAETLGQAVAAAIEGNPTLAAARARQQAMAETPEQARASGRLSASADAGGGYDRFNFGRGGIAAISAALPIWTGGRVPSAVRAASGDVAAGEAGLRDTTAGLIEAVVRAYASLLYDEEAVKIARADIALLDNQVADARARFRLGNATRTDVARLEAQQSAAGATLASAEATIATDGAGYRALVGHDPDSLTNTSTSSQTLPATLVEARGRALVASPLYQRSQRIAEAGAARIDLARANRNPNLSLGASYAEYADFGRHSNPLIPATTSAGLTLHIPLLTGGLVASQVRQARADYRADLADVDAAAREAVRAADAAWAALAGIKAQTQADVRSVDAAELALRGVRAEYSFGLRSTLDILVADESLRGAQLALAHSRSETLVAEAALLRATGHLDDSAFP